LIREALFDRNVVIETPFINGIISVSHDLGPRLVNLPRCARNAALA